MQQVLTLGSFVFFTGLVGFLTWRLTRGDRHDTSAGYFLGGRALTGGYIAGSLMLTNLSTEQLVGLNGDAFADGLCVMAWEVIAGMSLVVMALFFLPRYLKSGVATVPEFLEKRFNESTRTITTLIFIVAYAGILLPIILYTGATGLMGILNLEQILGLPKPTVLWLSVWLIGIIGSIYAIFGGLRTVAVSDTLNGFGLLVGGILIAWLGLKAINPEAPLSALSEIQQAHPEKFNSLGGRDQSVPFSTLFTGVLLLNLFYWCTNQQIIQRTFGASTLAEGQKGVLFAGTLKILAPIILVLPGIIAFYLFGQILVGEETIHVQDVVGKNGAVVATIDGRQQVLKDDEILETLKIAKYDEARQLEGRTVKQGEKTVTIEKWVPPHRVIALAEDGSNRYLAPGEFETFVKPDVTENSERQSKPSGDEEAVDPKLKKVIGPPQRVNAYGMLVDHVLPPWLAGFFAAVIVGAILSSFNSALNSTATLFSLGVYQHMIHPDASDEQVIKSGKWFGWIIAIAAMSTAPLLAGQDSIFGYLQKMNGLYFIPIFSVVLIGIVHRRVPALAANTALVVGFLSIILGYFVPPFKDWAGEIHEFHFLGAVFAILVLFMLTAGTVSGKHLSRFLPRYLRPLISNFEPLAEPWRHVDSKEVDLTPWKPAKIFGLVLVVIVLSLYVTFADFSVVNSP